MREYESLVILDPSADEAEYDKIVGKVEDAIAKSGGTLSFTDRWGKRRMTYEIRKSREGYYVLFAFKSNAAFLAELEKLYRFTPFVMRAMTTLALPEKYRVRKAE